MATARYRMAGLDSRRKDLEGPLKNGITPLGEAVLNGRINGHYAPKSNGSVTSLKKRKPPKGVKFEESCEKVPFIPAALTHFGFYVLMFLGFINQLLFTPKVTREQNREGYTPLFESFESFYHRYVYRRVRDCWNRPICSVPGAMVTLKDRITRDYGWTFEFTGTESPCINLGSYNYLGFAESTGTCAEKSIETLKKFGCASCSTRLELGNLAIHDELEKQTARFLGVEDAIVFGMGFATNSLNLPSLVGKGCLVLSDEKNHASLILGLRLSGAVTRVFKHNNIDHLEECLQKGVVLGQPDSGKPWRKILIVVEGVYSMEGSIVNLPKILELKRKYKAYIYLDEAHSTGAMGKHGRGVCDYYRIDPREIDILMGTFTKSFGSAGGYIAGTKVLIDHLRVHSHAHTYASAMSPPVAQQIITAMRIISGEDGTDIGRRRTKQLARNTRYFRRRLHQMGVIIYGNDDSPVVPMLVYLFSKIGAVVRTLTTRKIATVGVGFPATPLMEGRIRFCLSAAHTKEQLDYVLSNVEEMANTLGLKYSRKPRDSNPIDYYSGSDTE
ncbi:serine palmitoyltransferase 2 [Orussus abietinus]|uniref:serine palmitoyltransferase 2 n=1 Tax=Orussus abietinus TaxID=222816 RepID=UPI000625EAE2|nr:serine palmitoyltransferase 2 [Orussus abietinus]XP_012271807.1 serine palmitoyltransferase 2 [Orussus abietinus]XP_023287952.1 serine palmitoyltransferase 2 [Orussus abietinus]